MRILKFGLFFLVLVLVAFVLVRNFELSTPVTFDILLLNRTIEIDSNILWLGALFIGLLAGYILTIIFYLTEKAEYKSMKKTATELKDENTELQQRLKDYDKIKAIILREEIPENPETETEEQPLLEEYPSGENEDEE